MKNHIRVNGKSLQTNKGFSHLKQRQKEWISGIFRDSYHSKMKELHTNTKLPRETRDEIVRQVYEKIEARGIWIPFGELEKYCFSNTTKVVNGYTPNKI
ncbi:hypothetical protein [Bacillus toyonensis]|uniref:hypothetical protein n=1 Tax=Bacillus toyonensis TaxID=155322 RepID=UPI002E1A11DF|nr:hypothetical protein [Bacillus toyonensis]